MTRHEFMHSTPSDIHARIKIKNKEIKTRWQMIEYQSWLTGLYTMRAIGTAFSKHGKYPDNPLEIQAKSIESIAERNGRSEEEMQRELLIMSLRINEANSNISRHRARIANAPARA